jgi:hypothetical protein
MQDDCACLQAVTFLTECEVSCNRDELNMDNGWMICMSLYLLIPDYLNIERATLRADLRTCHICADPHG